MPKPKKPQENLKKEDILQAVLIANDFAGWFEEYTKEGSSVLIPLVNSSIIDYALEFLGRSGIQETIIFCCTYADVIKNHIRQSKWSQSSSPMNITVIVSERCQSLGDAMRDIDNKALIKGDFVLLSALTVSNLNLMEIFDYHKEKIVFDKGTAMTLILQDVGGLDQKVAETVIAVNNATDRLLLYAKPGLSKKIDLPLEYLLENSNLRILSSLIDTGIAICSSSVPVLFADNFDFQTKEDFIRGLLLNEEILDSRIYSYEVNNGYGATISNWKAYQRVSRDIIHRWTFPFVPDQPLTNAEPFCHYRHCVYKQPGVQLLDSVILEMDVAVGQGSQLGSKVHILRSVIGKNCKIGNNVSIIDSFIFDNSVIENNCSVHLTVVGEHCTIGQSSSLTKCFLKYGVSLKKKLKLTDAVISSKPLASNEVSYEKLGEQAFAVKKLVTKDSESEDEGVDITNVGLLDPDAEINEDELEESSDSEPEDSFNQSPEPDDTILFYTEVVDSLQRGYEEKLSCENLILEINSSRYAYNVTLSDVTTLTVKAIFSLPSRVESTSKALLVYFLPLLKNYIKSSDAQMECLGVVEEIHEDLGKEVIKCLHFLYDSDVISEDNIMEWHEKLEPGSSIRPKIAPFIKWLREAAEESSSEESD